MSSDGNYCFVLQVRQIMVENRLHDLAAGDVHLFCLSIGMLHIIKFSLAVVCWNL